MEMRKITPKDIEMVNALSDVTKMTLDKLNEISERLEIDKGELINMFCWGMTVFMTPGEEKE